jgi:hypothetical protein
MPDFSGRRTRQQRVLQMRKLGCLVPVSSAVGAARAFQSFGGETLPNTGFITTAGAGKIGFELEVPL